MTNDRASNVGNALLRSLGALAIADSHLSRLRRDIDGFPAGHAMSGWCDFADHLHDLANGAVAAAVAAKDAASPLVMIDMGQRRYTMGPGSVDELTGKLHQHARVAYLIGYEPSRNDRYSEGRLDEVLAARDSAATSRATQLEKPLERP